MVALYIVGYKRPPNHPLPVSIAAIASTSLEYLSLAIWPIVADHCRPAGLIVALLIAATLARLCWVGWRQPVERARAFAMIAVLLAMIGAALAVGISRSFIGGRAGRYVTTTAPLLCRPLCCLVGSWISSNPTTRARFVVCGGGSDGSGEYQVWAQGRSPSACGLQPDRASNEVALDDFGNREDGLSGAASQSAVRGN